MDSQQDNQDLKEGEKAQFLSIFLGDQEFGVDISSVQDVLKGLSVTSVPMASNYITGICNLRGRIVTAIDLHKRMYKNAAHENPVNLNVVIDSNGELYSILVDRVGDVLTLAEDDIEPPPLTLNAHWRSLCKGVHKRDGGLMIMLDTDKIIHGENVQNKNKGADS